VPISPSEAAARAIAVEWFRPGEQLEPEKAAMLWWMLTDRERQRFRTLARLGVEAYREAVEHGAA
jgi:hypothetical protein